MEMIGSQSPEAMFRMAQGLPDDRLTAILAGQDGVLPQFVAQAVLSERQRIRQAQAGQQAQAQMAQEQPTKKDELLAQAQNMQGIASVAPDDVAELAGGGIVAFSGKDGDQEVEAPMTYGEQMRRLANVPGALLRRLVSAPGYGLSSYLFDSAPASPAYTPDVSTSDLPGNGASRSPTPAEAVRPAVVPARAGGGGGGGGRTAPAAAAPAAATPERFDTKPYFKAPEGARPTLGDLKITNPYAEAKSPEDYIAQNRELYKKFGVSETPYAEREAELKAAQAGGAEKLRNAGLMGLLNFGTMLASATGPNIGQNIGLAGQKAAERYQADVEKLDALEEKRKEALQAIRMANNDIKRGQVDEGLRKRDAAEAKRADAAFKIAELTARQQQSKAEIEAKVWGAEYEALSRQGVAALGADVELKKMAQQAQLSREEIAARLQAARISAAASAARGERTTIEKEVFNQLRADGKSAPEAYAILQGIKSPPDPLKAGIAAAMGGGSGVPARPANAVQPSR